MRYVYQNKPVIAIYSNNKKQNDSMSAGTIRKAKKLVQDGNVVKIGDDLFQVRSSTDPQKSYMVTPDSCDCLGFKNFYKFHHGKGLKANCSHLEAVGIYLNLSLAEAGAALQTRNPK